MRTDITAYEGLNQFCYTHGLASMNSLSTELGLPRSKSFVRKAKGLEQFKLDEIKKIIKATGMTFEELFE